MSKLPNYGGYSDDALERSLYENQARLVGTTGTAALDHGERVAAIVAEIERREALPAPPAAGSPMSQFPTNIQGIQGSD